MIIDGNSTVRDLLSKHPEVFVVLERHGMCADCKAEPPPVPLGHFAMKHCGGNLPGLIIEIERAIQASDAET